jgi:hypothetical protein
MILKVGFLVAVGVSASVAFAEPTRELSVSGSREVLEGDPESASVDAHGQILMGSMIVELGKVTERPITTLVAGANNTVLVGTAGGEIVRVDAAGKPSVLAKAENEIVTALAVNGTAIYAATSGGKIYAVEGNKLRVMFDPEAKYVWAILPDGADLLVATGEPGQVLRVAPNGTSKVVFDPGETHVRTLLRHPKRGVIAGGGQKGIVYQLKDTGAFALYDSELEECAALAFDAATGDLYAALVSESKPGALDPDKTIGAVAGEAAENDSSPIKGSDVVRISASGRVDLLWTSKRDGALGLAFEPKAKRLYLATGTGAKGRGRIYAVELVDRDRVLLVARTEAPIASAIIFAPTGGALIVGTAPSGKLLRIGPGTRSESVYISSEQDLSRISRVGRVWFDAELPAGSRVELTIRTGNTKEYDKTWSAWSNTIDNKDGGPVNVPEGRYAQFRVTLKATPNGAKAPRVKSLHASVVRMNVAPTVQEVFVLRRGVYMSRMPPEEEKEKTVTLSRTTISALRTRDDDDETRSVRVRQGIRTGWMSIAWRADDPNTDDLLYRVEMLRLDEPDAAWTTVVPESKEAFWSFDSRAYRDGRYRFRVTASDRPANPPHQALFDKNESEPIVIDNGAPRIRGVKATSAGAGRLRVEAEAEDDTSLLGVAEMSLNGGPWLMLPAADGLLDAKREALSVEVTPSEAPGVPEIKTGRHSVLVRVEDEAGNEATASTTVLVR